MAHARETGHQIAVSLSDLSFWDFGQDAGGPASLMGAPDRGLAVTSPRPGDPPQAYLDVFAIRQLHDAYFRRADISLVTAAPPRLPRG